MRLLNKVGDKTLLAGQTVRINSDSHSNLDVSQKIKCVCKK
jgi:hypothetical protein